MGIDFDIRGLRAMVVGVDLGGFTHAARRLNRSQSAISMQLRKLEDQAGQPLFKRSGRGLALTDAGQVLLQHARRLIALNDEAALSVGKGSFGGTVRIGMPQDFVDLLLPVIVGKFAKIEPGTLLELRAGRNYALADDVAHGRLDAALTFAEPKKGQRNRIAHLPRVWVGSAIRSTKLVATRPVPLVLFDAPCLFREKGIEALDRGGVAWRLALTTPSLAGVWASVRAGLGLTVRTTIGVPSYLSILASGDGLPKLPPVDLLILSAQEPTSRAKILIDVLHETVASTLVLQ